MSLICLLLFFYLLAIFVSVVLSWFPLNHNGAMAAVAGFVYTVTDPVMKPVRRLVPAARFGRTAIDFSPIIVIFGIQIIRRILC